MALFLTLPSFDRSFPLKLLCLEAFEKDFIHSKHDSARQENGGFEAVR